MTCVKFIVCIHVHCVPMHEGVSEKNNNMKIYSSVFNEEKVQITKKKMKGITPQLV